jgi:uncharacterized protein YuzE
MRIRYDAEVDALSIIFRDTTVTTAELADGITAEYDAQGRLVGLEVLDATNQFGDPSVLERVVLEGIGIAASSTRRADVPPLHSVERGPGGEITSR